MTGSLALPVSYATDQVRSRWGPSPGDADQRSHRLGMFDRMAHTQLATPRMANHGPGADPRPPHGCLRDPRLLVPWCAGRRQSGQRRTVRGTKRGSPTCDLVVFQYCTQPGPPVRTTTWARGPSPRVTRHLLRESFATPLANATNSGHPIMPRCRQQSLHPLVSRVAEDLSEVRFELRLQRMCGALAYRHPERATRQDAMPVHEDHSCPIAPAASRERSS